MRYGRVTLFTAALAVLSVASALAQPPGGWGGGGPGGWGGGGPGGPGGWGGGGPGGWGGGGPGGPGGWGGGGPGGWGGRGEGGRGGEEPPKTAEEAQQRFRRAEFFLSELDANHNGIIEADECSGRRQYFVERMLQRAGLPTTFPVTLEKVREGLNRYYTASIQPGAPGQPVPGQQAPGTPGAPAAAAQPLVPGFGAPVLGFGTTAAQLVSTAAAAGGVKPGAAAPAASPAPSSGSHSDEERKYRDYAKNLIGQYDKNKNGVLDREEWGDMSNNPKAADRNGDGAVNFDELVAWLMSMSKPSGHGDSKSGDHKKSSKKPAVRIPSAIERLPSGLPDWFVKKDANTDGQVSMAEYSQDWSDAKIIEFAKYDVNRDGFITPAECLKVEKDGKASSKSGSSDRRGPPSGFGPPPGSSSFGPPKPPGGGPPPGPPGPPSAEKKDSPPPGPPSPLSEEKKAESPAAPPSPSNAEKKESPSSSEKRESDSDKRDSGSDRRRRW